MTERIKKIVSDYTKVPIDQIQPETVIGRSFVGNSIILHRMYAAIAKEGIDIPGYHEIKTFGELVNKINGKSITSGLIKYAEHRISLESATINEQGIGVDMEEISKMPPAVNFREEPFYCMNFTQEEISYCIIQPDVYASFTGLFAAKEAIVKADNVYKSINFNKIYIDHLPHGKPVINGFEISISHVQNFAIAVAIKRDHDAMPNSDRSNLSLPLQKNSSEIISIIAIIISVIAICISLFK